MSFFDQDLDHLDLLWNVRYCTRLTMGRQTIQPITVSVKLLRPAVGVVLKRDILSDSALDRLIIYVGQITHVKGLSPPHLQSTSEDILDHKSPEVTDMCRTIYRWSTAVKSIRLSIDRANV